MNIIFHEDFEGDMKLWGGESEDLDQNKAITFTLSLSDCLDQTPALFVVVREKQNNLDFHSSYPSG